MHVNIRICICGDLGFGYFRIMPASDQSVVTFSVREPSNNAIARLHGKRESSANKRVSSCSARQTRNEPVLRCRGHASVISRELVLREDILELAAGADATRVFS